MNQERIDRFRLMDNFFMKKFFSGNIEATQLVLRIILGRPDITVSSLKVESELSNFEGHRVVLDIHAKDGSGAEFDVEIQRRKEGASPQRAGYNLSLMHSHMLPKNTDFDSLKDAYVIFITETDTIGDNAPISVFETMNTINHKKFDDKRHIIYVNGAARCHDTELGRLMEDFFCQDADQINYPEIRNKFEYLKNTEEGRLEFMDYDEELIQEGAEKRELEIARNLIALGENSLESISKVTGINIEKLREMAGQQAV